MKTNILIFITLLMLISCKSSKIVMYDDYQSIIANAGKEGPAITLEFKKGKEHNHPSFVLWAEDMDGNYIQTLFITESLGTGVFGHGDASTGKWMPGEIRRPAAIPYWAHKRGITAEDGLYMPSGKNPVPDAYTGATPAGSFEVTTRFDEDPPARFKILFEINQTWDWNEYWTNNKYPDDDEYKTSCQPALVYAAEIDLNNRQSSYPMKVIGHSHYSGKTGELFTDLSTITTALDIGESITIKIPNL
ncbi:MAG: hypothetical protein ISS19_18195 [Bacteroidales bacterium]|nr:hypothetical protein [Bacteroidales bacterium]